MLLTSCAHNGCTYTIDAGLEQVRAGLAWHYKQYAHEQAIEERQRYAEAERRARVNRAGLWHDESPVPPWAFRRHAASGVSEHASAGIASQEVHDKNQHAIGRKLSVKLD